MGSLLAALDNGVEEVALGLPKPAHVVEEGGDADLLRRGHQRGSSLEEPRNPYPSVGVGQARQQAHHVDERFAHHSALHARVQVGLVGGDLR